MPSCAQRSRHEPDCKDWRFVHGSTSSRANYFGRGAQKLAGNLVGDGRDSRIERCKEAGEMRGPRLRHLPGPATNPGANDR